MYGVVKIGEKDVEMVANAATPYRYQAIFHKDFLAEVSGAKEVYPQDFFARMGYVMAMQASKKTDLSKLNEETFLTWLSDFEPSDVFAAADAIADIYNGSAETNTDPK